MACADGGDTMVTAVSEAVGVVTREVHQVEPVTVGRPEWCSTEEDVCEKQKTQSESMSPYLRTADRSTI